MPLIVEDGTMVEGAESYVTVSWSDTYHVNNGNAAWSNAENETKESALRKAARYLDGHYRSRLKGYKVAPVTQEMEWPRKGVLVDYSQSYVSPSEGCLPITSIPRRLKEAQCELALRALAGELAKDSDISIKREKVDVLDTEYAEGVKKGKISYRVIDHLLKDFLTSSSSSELVRC